MLATEHSCLAFPNPRKVEMQGPELSLRRSLGSRAPGQTARVLPGRPNEPWQFAISRVSKVSIARLPLSNEPGDL